MRAAMTAEEAAWVPIDWGYTGRAIIGRRRCRRCRKTREVVVHERAHDTGWNDEVMCVSCGLCWADYGGWSPQTWCRPKPGHERDWQGNRQPDTPGPPPPVRYELVQLPGLDLLPAGGTP